MAEAGVLAMILSCESGQTPPRPLLRVHGHALVRHAIRAAFEAPSVRRVVVWTDRHDEASEAGECEVVRFPWPALGAGLPSRGLVQGVLGRAAPVHERLLVVLPTRTPLRPCGTVRRAVEALRAGGADAVCAVVAARANFGRLRNGGFEPFRGDLLQRQDLDPVYFDTGSVYATTIAGFRDRGRLTGNVTAALVLDVAAGHEVTDTLDAQIGERLLPAGPR